MKKIALIILAGFAAISCTKDPITPDKGQGIGGINVQFTTPDFAQVSTRATDESHINDVWVLQYKDGVMDPSKAQLLKVENGDNFTKAVTLTGITEMLAPENRADSTKNFIIFLANLEKIGVSESEIKALKFVEDLEAFRINISNSEGFKDVLPMRGYYYGGISDMATNQLNVRLERTVAKINFSLVHTNFRDKDGNLTQFFPQSIRICKTPKQFGLIKSEYQPKIPMGIENGVLPEGFKPYPAHTDEFIDITDGLSPIATQYTVYVAENARGSYGSITNNKGKIPANAGAEGNYLTYIEVVGGYNEGTEVWQATYKIYLGGNERGDMNILANTTYNVTTNIYGADKNDTDIRIDPVMTFDEKDVPDLRPAANSLILDATNPADREFTIHLRQVVAGWLEINAGLQEKDKVKIGDLLADEVNWEAETLWKTWPGTEATSVTATGAGMKDVFDRPVNYYMTVKVPEGVENGNNCVIVLRDKRTHLDVDKTIVNPHQGKVMWSWHLWFTDYKPTLAASTGINQTAEVDGGQMHTYRSDAFLTGGLYAGKYMMDRNLGATITGVSETESIAKMMSTPATAIPANAVALRGMMYQWGRKDPFTPTESIDDVGNPAISTSTQLYDKGGNELTESYYETLNTPTVSTGVYILNGSGVSALAKGENVVYATQNPLHFLANGEWTGKGGNARRFWGATTTKGAFDPCPAGWRVPDANKMPKNNPWAGLNKQTGSESPIVNDGQNIDVFQWYSNGINGATAAARSTTGGRIFKVGITPTAWYPTSGLISSNGFNYVGSNGFNWSASVNADIYCFNMNIFSGAVFPAVNDSARSLGHPVRCVQE